MPLPRNAAGEIDFDELARQHRGEPPRPDWMDTPRAFAAGAGEGTQAIGEDANVRGKQIAQDAVKDPQMAGLGGMAASVGLEKLGELLDSAGRGIGEYFSDSMSEGGKAVNQMPLSESAKDPRNWPLIGAKMTGQIAPVIAGTAVAGSVGATALGVPQNEGMTHATAINQAQQEIGKKNNEELIQIPTFVNLFRAIDQAPQYQHLSDSQKIDLAKSQLAETVAMGTLNDPMTVLANIGGAIAGDARLGRLMLGGLAEKEGGGILKTALTEGAKQAAIGGGVAGENQYSINRALNDAGITNRDVMEGVGDSAIEGGVAGGIMGAPFGAVGGYHNRRAQRAAEVTGKDTAPGVDIPDGEAVSEPADKAVQTRDAATEQASFSEAQDTDATGSRSDVSRDNSASKSPLPDAELRNGLTPEQILQQKKLAEGFAEREKFGGSGPDEFADTPAYMRAGRKISQDPDPRPYHTIEVPGPEGRVNVRFDNNSDADIFEAAQAMDLYSSGKHPNPDESEHQALKDWFYRMTRGVKREEPAAKKRKRSKKGAEELQQQKQPHSDEQAESIRNTIMGYYQYVKEAARHARNGEYTAPSMADYATHLHPEPLQIEDKNIIFAGGEKHPEPSNDDTSQGTGPQFRGGRRVRGGVEGEYIPGDGDPGALEHKGNTIEGDARRVYPAVEDKNIIFSQGPVPDEGQKGTPPQFEKGKTKAQGRLERFEARVAARRKNAALPHRDIPSGKAALPDPVAEAAKSGNGELYMRRNGQPFPSEGLARLSKPYSEAKKAGKKPDVVKVEGGYAVEVPASEKTVKKQVNPVIVADTDAPTAQSVEQTASDIISHDAHRQFFERLVEHPEETTPEQVRAALESTLAGKESIIRSLNKLTKKQLEPFSGRYIHSDTKKDQLVKNAWTSLVNDFRWLTNKEPMLMTSMGRSPEDYAREAMSGITQADISDYAAAVKKGREERQRRLAAHRAALDNPQSLDDFRTLIKARGRDALTTAQAEKYDQLLAEHHLTQQKQQKEKPRITEGFTHDDDLQINLIEEGKNTRTGETVYNVNLQTRLGTEKFKEAASAARRMGGGYWRGNFWFPDREKAEQFTGWLQGDRVDHSADDAARRQQKQTQQGERLADTAERMRENAEERLNADRKVNTAKRLREAAHATASAERDIRDAQILQKIADGADDGSVKYLAGIRHKTQLDTLHRIKQRLIYDVPQAERDSLSYTTADGKREWNDDVPLTTRAKYARYPLLDWNPSTLADVLQKMGATPGFKLAAADLRLAQQKEHGMSRLPAGRKANDKLAAWLAKQPGSWPDYVTEYNRLQRAGITSRPLLRSALTELQRLDGDIPVKETPRLARMEQDLRAKLAGNRNAFVDFFPTPESQADYFVKQADIRPGHDVLEPSAGNGVLADAARRAGANVDVVELASDLREILKEKGHNVVGSDFDAFSPDKQYDRILMNPPFSGDLDISHVQKAYEHLKPGGKLAAIVSGMAGERRNRRNQVFRQWLDDLGAHEEPLPEGMFKASLNPTSVATKLITLTKPEDVNYSRAKGKYKDVSAADFTRQIKDDYDGVKLNLSGEGTVSTLDKIIIPESGRNKGTGTDIMQKIIRWADQNNRTLALSPSADFDGKKSRLVNFYKRFGFRDNKGRNKDYEISESMYRQPGDNVDYSRVKDLNEGMSEEDVKKLVSEFREEYRGNIPLDIDVYPTQEAAYGPRAKREEYGSTIKGGYHSQPHGDQWGERKRGRIVLAASSLREQGDVRRTLRHEILGHWGLNTFAPDEKKAILGDLIKAKSDPKINKIWQEVQHLYPEQDELRQAEEVFAHAAEIKPPFASAAWSKVLSHVHKVLRKIGLIKSPVTGAELLDTVNAISRGIRRGDAYQKTFPKSDHDQFRLADAAEALREKGIHVFDPNVSPRKRILNGAADLEPRGLSTKQVENEAARFLKKWKGAGGIDIQVAKDMAEAEKLAGFPLPKDARVHAMHLPNSGRIILVADNLDSLSHVRAKLRHEILGHHALSEVVGPAEYDKLLRTVAAGQNSTSLKPYFDRVLDNYDAADPWKQVEEVISHVLEDGERGIIGRAWDRVSGAVLRSLRKAGFLNEENLTATEVRHLMRPISQRLKRLEILSAREANAVDTPNFSLTGKDGLFTRPRPGETETEATKRRATGFGKQLGDAIGNIRGLDVAKMGIKETFKHLANPFFITVGTNRQLATVYNKMMKVDYAGKYQDFQSAMEARRNRIMTSAERGIENQWGKLNKEEGRKLSDLMVDATMTRIHPDKPLAEQALFQKLKNEHTRLGSSKNGSGDDESVARLQRVGADLDAMRQNHAELQKRWKELSPEAKVLYRDTERWYSNSYKDLKEALIQRINDVGGDQHAALISRIREQFEKALKDGPYFPLARFGKYIVTARKEGDYIREHFESKAAALAALEAYKKDGYEAVQSVKPKVNGKNDDSAYTMGKNILDLVQKSEDGSLSKEELTDQIWQQMLELMPDASYARHFIRRRRVKGASHDARRAFANSAFHFAHHISKIEFGHKMGAVLDDMGNEIDAAMKGDYGGVKSENLEVAQRMLDEMKMRHEMTMNPSGDGFSAALTGVGYVYNMAANISSALINATQTALVALPQLAARYGWRNATKALGRATVDYFRSADKRFKWFGKDSAWLDKDAWISLGNSKHLAADEIELIKRLNEDGAISITQSSSLAQRAETGTQDKVHMNKVLENSILIGGQLFHNVEVANREVTALAAYRLAKEMAGGRVDPEVAYKIASNAIYDAHFDYASSNRPRWMRQGWQKVLFQFKMYSQHMFYTLGRSLGQSVKGETPEIRKQAFKEFMGYMLMHTLAAGVAGLPWAVQAIFGSAAKGIHAAVSDDEGPWDPEVAMKNWLTDELGGFASTAITDGLVNALGVDLHSRVGIQDLLWRKAPEGTEGRDLYVYYMEQMLGPTIGGIGLNFAGGYEKIAKGDWLGGVKSVTPAAVRNLVKTYEEATKGVTTAAGDEIVPADEFSGIELAAQAFGFSPSRIGMAYDARSAVKGAQSEIQRERSLLLQRYFRTVMEKGDTSDILDDIQEFNHANPENGITGESIVKSVRAKQRARVKKQRGVALSRKDEHLRKLGRFGDYSPVL